jgi:predicted Zn-dependent peptidase
MEFLSTTLPNGLQIIAERNDEVHSAALGFFVRAGARDEVPAVSGVSHFLEHMVFKGTARRSGDDINRQFDAIGADNNAFTTKEATVFWAAVLPEYLESALDLLADMLRPALNEDDFLLEKQVILEEIKMYEDQPPFGADELCEAIHFGVHSLGGRILGTTASIERLSVEQMREYFRRHYGPQNMVLAAAGRLDFDHLVRTATRLCGDWPPQNGRRDITPAPRTPGFSCIHKPSATQQYVVQLAAAPTESEHERYACDLLTTILGDASGSRLYWELIDTGIAEHAAVYYSEYQGAGAFCTVMSCIPQQARENLHRIREVYCRAEYEGFTPAELDQAKNKTKSRIVLAGERPRRRLFSVGGHWLLRGEYLSLQQDLAGVDATSPDDLHRVLCEYPLTNSTTVTAGPLADLADAV